MVIDDALGRELHRRALRDGRKLSGLYHDNYVVTHDGSPYVVRVPRVQPDDVEPRMFAESAVLAALPPGLPVPRLLYRSSFLITSWCPGRPVDSPAPDAMFDTLALVNRELYRVRLTDLGTPAPWHGPGFIGGLLGWLDRIHQNADGDEQRFLSAAGLPSRPFAPGAYSFHGHPRRPRLCHGDLQRPNFLFQDEACHLIDWELAAWADPLWDVAAHIHRAGYPPEQEARALPALLATIPEWSGSRADLQDYATFLHIERLRSLVLDALRHLRSGITWPDRDRRIAVHAYHGKLRTAGVDVDPDRLWDLHVAHWSRAGRG